MTERMAQREHNGTGGRGRCVRLFLDDASNLDFHQAFRDEAARQCNSLLDLDPSLKIEVRECFGSQERQLWLVRQVASQLYLDSEDLVCLFPTDHYAIVDLQDVLFAERSARVIQRREKLVCAVVHQILPKTLVEHPESEGKRIFSVGADQIKMGKLQAEQVLRLTSTRASRPRKIIYISGPGHSSATRLRIAGAVETLLLNNIFVQAMHAEWDGRKVGDALDDWRRMGGSLDGLDAVAAHNDQIAETARDKLDSWGRPDIPVVGMDGTDRLGKRLVSARKLAATVVQPLGVKEVFERYKLFLEGQLTAEELREEPNVRLDPTSFPLIADIAPLPAD